MESFRRPIFCFIFISFYIATNSAADIQSRGFVGSVFHTVGTVIKDVVVKPLDVVGDLADEYIPDKKKHVDSTSDSQSRGIVVDVAHVSVAKPLEAVGEIAVADDVLTGQENKKTPEQAKDDDWVEVPVDGFVNENNQTVVFVEGSPIKVLDTPVDVSSDPSGQKLKKLISVQEIKGT